MKRSAPDFAFERELIARGRALVAGVDEVGRGPLAGPLGVAAVILDPDDPPEGVDDSKALSSARREALSQVIYAKARCVSIAFASVAEIDALNIRGATLVAMARAVNALSLRADFALVDGLDVPDGLRCPARVAADDRCGLDRRQGRARCADEAARRRLSGLWIRAPRRLSHSRACRGAGAARPDAVSPALVHSEAAFGGKRRHLTRETQKSLEIVDFVSILA